MSRDQEAIDDRFSRELTDLKGESASLYSPAPALGYAPTAGGIHDNMAVKATGQAGPKFALRNFYRQ